MPTKTRCFGFANIITRIRIQIRDKLHKDPDPEGKQLKRKIFKLISNKSFTNIPANLDKVKNNNNNTNIFFKIFIFALPALSSLQVSLLISAFLPPGSRSAYSMRIRILEVSHICMVMRIHS